jgi:hypothetical protein
VEVRVFSAAPFSSPCRRQGREELPLSIDDTMIDTPDGPMTFAQWKKKNPVQLPSRRTKGKKLPNKVKLTTDEK